MSKIRYGVIGLRGIGGLHCAVARENERLDLVAVADSDEELLRNKADHLQVRGFTDYREMIAAGIVDAVSIATPHHLHATMGLDCLNAGVHVFVEKPFANFAYDADRMIRVADANNLKICVGHQYRLHRASVAMKEAIDGGVLGRILRVQWSWCEFRPESYYSRDAWRATWRNAGGGVLTNQASHDLDLLCWMLGTPVQVTAIIANQLHDAEVEDTVSASVLFASGALASLQFTINQPKAYSIRHIVGEKGMLVMQNVQSLTSDQDEQILIGAYEGALPRMLNQLTGIADQPRIEWRKIKISRSSGLRRLASRSYKATWVFEKLAGPEKRGPHPIATLMDSFARAIADDGAPLVTGESARSAVALINALVLSAMRRKTVDLPLNPDEYSELFEELATGKIKVPRLRAGTAAGSVN